MVSGDVEARRVNYHGSNLTLYKLCVFPIRMCITNESRFHTLQGCAFTVRMNHKDWEWRCDSVVKHTVTVNG